ncbi:MAG TPA: ABC transporter ATP-binding protein [Spirochaetia bacterium]|nr:ABC transporter ATP-binding protein [Spirochaetia bacterium]
MTEPLISCSQLTKTYPLNGVEVKALNGVDLSVEKGEMVAIMGASGSGKSTLMNIVGCMDRVTSGRYFLEGVDVSDFSNEDLAHLRNQKIGFVFQRYNLLPRMSVWQNVMLPMVYAGRNGPQAKKKVLDALEMVGIGTLAYNQPNQMSGGQQQRAAIARALINDPQLILADEPTGALDSASSAEVMAILQNLHREKGVTLVIVTHERDIAAYCEREVVMRDGRVLSDRTSKNGNKEG